MTPMPSPHSASGGRPTVSVAEAPMVGALFRRLPSREIPPTRMKLWVIIGAAVLAALAIGLVLI